MQYLNLQNKINYDLQHLHQHLNKLSLNLVINFKDLHKKPVLLFQTLVVYWKILQQIIFFCIFVGTSAET